jgi:hypothetical protein
MRILMPRTKQTQGFTPEIQYSALNAARDKRKRRAERNLKIIMSGGCKQIPIIRGNS